MDEIQKILVAADELPASCWDAFRSEYAITFVRDGYHAEKLLSRQQFDIVFLDIFLFGMDGLNLLRLIQKNHLCTYVVLTSETPNFQYAREGLIHGACDYIMRPFQEDTLRKTLDRLHNQPIPSEQLELSTANAVCSAIGTSVFEHKFEQGVEHLRSSMNDSFDFDRAVKTLYHRVSDYAFNHYQWLPLYRSSQGNESIHNFLNSDSHIVVGHCLTQASEINNLIMRLQPPLENKNLANIVEHMLFNVDEIFSQKEIASLFFISSSTLSTYFSSSPLKSYRTYNQELKMTRAEFLLKNTDLKIYEICERLGFHDVNYFSQLFKQRTGTTISEYRRTDFYDYQI